MNTRTRLLLVVFVGCLVALGGCVGGLADGVDDEYDRVGATGDEPGVAAAGGPDVPAYSEVQMSTADTQVSTADTQVSTVDTDASTVPGDGAVSSGAGDPFNWSITGEWGGLGWWGGPDGELEIHHLDVGQADATLLVAPSGETVLVDTGDWPDDGEVVIDYLEAEGIDRIDHLVATHAHADHIGGHAAVIEYAETEGDGIGAAYDSGVSHTTQTYEQYLDAVEEYDVDLFEVQEGDVLPLEDEALEATVLNPPARESGDDLHYNSITLAFEFGHERYLTTGDAEVDAEERMVEDWRDDLRADAYHAGHHGSSTSSTEAFLSAVDPAITIVSSDFDSQFGHPHDEVLERFADHGIETYWTGVHGDVVLTTGGHGFGFDVETESAFSTDPLDLLAEKPGSGDEDDGDGDDDHGDDDGDHGDDDGDDDGWWDPFPVFPWDEESDHPLAPV